MQVAGNAALQPHASRELAVAMQAAGSKVPGAALYAARMLSSCKAHDEAVLALLAQGQVSSLQSNHLVLVIMHSGHNCRLSSSICSLPSCSCKSVVSGWQ